MRLGEAVLAEAEDLPVKRGGDLGAVAVRPHAVLQLRLEMLEAAAPLPGRHRATHPACLSRAEAGSDDRELHHLLLGHRHAEGALEDLPDLRAGIGHRLLASPAAKIRMHHPALAV